MHALTSSPPPWRSVSGDPVFRVPVAVRRVRAWHYWQSGNVGPSVNVYVSVCRTVSRYGSAALESMSQHTSTEESISPRCRKSCGVIRPGVENCATTSTIA